MANPEPGGIARVVLGQAELTSLKARFGQYRVIVNQEAGLWVALVGLPISIEPGHYILSLEAEDQESLEPVVFSVKPAKTTVLQVPQEPLPLSEPRGSIDDIRSAAEIVDLAVGSWNDESLPDFGFGAPVHGAQLYPYSLLVTRGTGHIRPHDYITFLAAPGSSVIAPQDGRVQAVVDLPSHGNSVFIDHGQGLYSMLGGLDEITVDPETFVRRGNVIGTIKQTDFNAMRKVDWVLHLNGQKIDPARFLTKEPTVNFNGN